LLIPEHVTGLPVLRALSLCTCCRHYPGAADGLQTSLKLAHPYQPSPKWVSGRPAHRPFRGLLSVHSRCGLHTRTVTYVTVIRGLQTFRHLHACPGCFRREQFAGWDLHPLENAAFARRTPVADIQADLLARHLLPVVHVSFAPFRSLARAQRPSEYLEEERAAATERGLGTFSTRAVK